MILDEVIVMCWVPTWCYSGIGKCLSWSFRLRKAHIFFFRLHNFFAPNFCFCTSRRFWMWWSLVDGLFWFSEHFPSHTLLELLSKVSRPANCNIQMLFVFSQPIKMKLGMAELTNWSDDRKGFTSIFLGEVILQPWNQWNPIICSTESVHSCNCIELIFDNAFDNPGLVWSSYPWSVAHFQMHFCWRSSDHLVWMQSNTPIWDQILNRHNI